MAAVQIPDRQITVTRVQVSGLARTKNDIVVEQIKDVLKVSSMKEMFVEALLSVERLQAMKIFKHVALKVDTDKREGKNGVEITFLVKEHGLLRSAFSASAGTQSGDASFSMAVRNVFGRAEQLEGTSGTSFPLWGHTVQLQFSKPYYRDLNKRLVLSLGTTDTKLPMCGYDEVSRGAAVEIHSPSWLGDHTLSYNASWREVTGFTHNTPLSVRTQAGHSLKSGIKHTLVSDERDNPLWPRSGYKVQLTQELAGLGGDTMFGKAEIQSEVHKQLWREWVLSLSLWGGVMRPLRSSRINDRFLLGGPSTLRGFGLWGVGPRDNGYSLGGEAYWATGLHLFVPIFSNEFLQRIRLHGFLTTGNLIQSNTIPGPCALVRGTRLSCGLGVHFRLGVAQIELNYAVPLRAAASDELRPGLQFGIGLDML